MLLCKPDFIKFEISFIHAQSHEPLPSYMQHYARNTLFISVLMKQNVTESGILISEFLPKQLHKLF